MIVIFHPYKGIIRENVFINCYYNSPGLADPEHLTYLLEDPMSFHLVRFSKGRAGGAARRRRQADTTSAGEIAPVPGFVLQKLKR